MTSSVLGSDLHMQIVIPRLLEHGAYRASPGKLMRCIVQAESLVRLATISNPGFLLLLLFVALELLQQLAAADEVNRR